MPAVLHQSLPEDMRQSRRLPGIAPARPGDWLRVDHAYEGQMRCRTALLNGRPAHVFQCLPQATGAAEELLQTALELMQAAPELGFAVTTDSITRPDGGRVARTGHPLMILGQVLQQDLCLLQQQHTEHVLTGAVLCFPSNWYLSEKIGRPLSVIHDPVAEYDANIAKRVQRLFDGVQVSRPIWRFNQLWHESSDLFQPERIPPTLPPAQRPFYRTERQTLFRLPLSKAVVFSIHTYVMEAAQARRCLAASHPG